MLVNITLMCGRDAYILYIRSVEFGFYSLDFNIAVDSLRFHSIHLLGEMSICWLF